MRLPVETANLRRRANLDWVRQLSRLILAQPEFVGDGFNIVKEKQDEIRVELRSRAGFLHVKAYDMAEGDTILSVLGKTSRGTSIKRQIPLDDKAVASLSKILASINPFAFRMANFDAYEIGQPVPGPVDTFDSDEPWMGDHFTQENFEQLQDAQIDGELGPTLDLSRHANLDDACWEDYEAFGMKEMGGRQVPNCVPVRNARFHEGPEGRKEFKQWMEDQPEEFQEEWEENTDKYKDKFKAASRAWYTNRNAGFAKGDTEAWKLWMEDQPEEFQNDWKNNTEKYKDKFKSKKG